MRGKIFFEDLEFNDDYILKNVVRPIQISSIDALVETVEEEWWQEDMKQYMDDENYGIAFLDLAADDLHKDNISDSKG
ncbi:MAG: hypothetical protein IPH74_11435 [Bacteroidetes bacterium]|nr:hypothetical protein [Bacteroidota bacterium]